MILMLLFLPMLLPSSNSKRMLITVSGVNTALFKVYWQLRLLKTVRNRDLNWKDCKSVKSYKNARTKRFIFQNLITALPNIGYLFSSDFPYYFLYSFSIISRIIIPLANSYRPLFCTNAVKIRAGLKYGKTIWSVF